MQDTIAIVNNIFQNDELSLDSPKTWTVSELSKNINNTLEARIGRVKVSGQINRPKLGHHWYFTLADEDAKIDCAMWSSHVLKIKTGGWQPKQGDLVEAEGVIGHYAKFGKTQLYVDRLNPAGDQKGALQIQFEKLVKEFRERGWFDDSNKKPLPKYPRKIAVITSKSSAAAQDVIETARQRWASIPLCIVNVPVQGAAAVPAIVNALQAIDSKAESWGIDAIIVTRGGGALEELWSFNEREVAEAAFKCKTPIVAAIGHESDTSIIELVADWRASTPTQAAMVLVPDADELEQMVSHLSDKIQRLMLQRLERYCTQTERHAMQLANSCKMQIQQLYTQIISLSEILVTKRPHAKFQMRQRHLFNLKSKLNVAFQSQVHTRKAKIQGMASAIESSNPRLILNRGFSLTQDSAGRIVRSIQVAKKDAKIKTLVADGTIESTVECTYE